MDKGEMKERSMNGMAEKSEIKMRKKESKNVGNER
jgi:hypothetical protein